MPTEVRAGIPCPQTSNVSPVERRLLTEGNHPRIRGRTIELDERQVQPLTWALNREQVAEFRGWWREDLVFGGAWFTAPETWPTPEGLVVKVRRFLGAPALQYLGNGNWLASAACEVRGRTLIPADAPPAEAYFLDNFDGSEMSLFEHVPDIAPEGFAYLKPGFGDGLRLEGGRALTGFGVGATNYNGSNTSPSSWEPMLFPGGLRFEFRGHTSGGSGEYYPVARAVLYAADSSGQIEVFAGSSDGEMFGIFNLYGTSFSVSGSSASVPEGDFTAVLSLYPNGVTTLQFNDAALVVVQGSGDPATMLDVGSTYYELSNVDPADSNLDRIELSPVEDEPPEPPSEGVLFYDDFGGSGSLVGHVPDVAPDGFEWAAGDPVGLSINGGHAFNSGDGNYTTSNIETWSVAPTANWRAEMVANVLATAEEPSSQAYWYLGGGDDLSGFLIEIRGISGSDPAQATVRVHIAGEEYQGTGVPEGAFTIRVDVEGSVATIYVNGEEVGTLTGDFSGFATITYTELAQEGTEAESQIQSVELSTLDV